MGRSWEGERGGGGEKFSFLRSFHLPLLLIFRTPSRAVSFPSRKFLETPATQASYHRLPELKIGGICDSLCNRELYGKIADRKKNV